MNELNNNIWCVAQYNSVWGNYTFPLCSSYLINENVMTNCWYPPEYQFPIAKDYIVVSHIVLHSLDLLQSWHVNPDLLITAYSSFSSIFQTKSVTKDTLAKNISLYHLRSCVMWKYFNTCFEPNLLSWVLDRVLLLFLSHFNIASFLKYCRFLIIILCRFKVITF